MTVHLPDFHDLCLGEAAGGFLLEVLDKRGGVVHACLISEMDVQSIAQMCVGILAEKLARQRRAAKRAVDAQEADAASR